MRRMILLLAFATLLFSGASGARSAEPESTALAIVQIAAQPGSRLGDANLVRPLLISKILLKEAVAHVSDMAAESTDISEVAKVECEFDPNLLMHVAVNSYDSRVPADKLLEALVGVLNSRLRDITGKEYEAAARRLDKENARVEKLAADLRKQHEALIQLAAIHRVEIDPALAAQKRLRIETEVQSLDVQLQGLKARQEVLQAHIAELGEKVAVDAADDLLGHLLLVIGVDGSVEHDAAFVGLEAKIPPSDIGVAHQFAVNSFRECLAAD